VARVALLLASVPSIAAGLTPDDSKAVAVLTARFETVVYLTGRLVSDTAKPGVLNAVDSVRLAVYECRLFLDELRPDAGRSLAELSTSVLVGAKDFRSPSGPPPNLGGVRSTRSCVFTLRPGLRYDLDARLGSAARVRGMPATRTWKARQHEGEPAPVSWFAAAAGTRYVILANDLEELRAAVRLLAGQDRVEPPPVADAPLLVNQKAWGYRRYRIAQTKDPAAAGTMDLSPSATALVVVPDEKSNRVRLRLHGTPGDRTHRTKIIDDSWSSHIPQFKETEPGVWESVATMEGAGDADAEMLLSVLYLLGFGGFL
jgi:hypothetical protein